MRYTLRLAVCAVTLLAAFSAHGVDRSECKQYGGTANCWMPVIGPWKHTVCGEWASGPGTVSEDIAWCEARGGTWGGSLNGCQGLPPPEYRRPTSEADMRPLAEETFTGAYGPLCEGPVSQSFSWGGVYGSVNCGNGNGPAFDRWGYEVGNTATPFAVTGKRLQSGVCSTTDTVLGFKGWRLRAVSCGGAEGASSEDFFFTEGATPSLCYLGRRQPTNPKQECDGCKSSV